ncbi:class I SAM-dependent methyltransferase [Embleya sp. NPDC059259]|uniref:class I SAM-dependent methyltransferase n=1 Tax=unclassified Embleya TaxID=2699296 RepID=UPI003673A118
MFDYDAELARYHEHLWEALDVRPGDRVLDIGCGTGQITRRAARAASPGTALGIDISDPMLTQARRQAETEGLANLDLVRADAQTHPFPPGQFTVAVSRFGTMFFADTTAAFANIARALRPGALFAQLVWQPRDHQQWDTEIRAALAPGRSATTSTDKTEAAFTLADPDVATSALTTAGFTTVRVTDVREPVYYGPDADHAQAAVLHLQPARDLLGGLTPAATEHALARLHTMLATHTTAAGVWLDSRAWLITARRR